MGTCASSLWRHIRSTLFAANTGSQQRPHRAVQSTLKRLIEQAGGYADLERHVPELYDWVSDRDGAAPVMLLVLECPTTALDRCQCAMPACRTLQRKCVETGSGCSCWRNRKSEALWKCRAIVGLRDSGKTVR